MSIPRSGTFNYAGIVPDGHVQSSGRWQMRDASGAESSSRVDSLVRDRLVGLQPSLEIADAGVIPDVRVSPYTGNVRPKVLLSRLTLRAGSRDRATVTAFSFCVDQAFTRSWRGGDVLHVARTGCGGIGVSVVRGDRLIAAIGAVTAVPHGGLVSVRIPTEVIREAESVFSRMDPRFEFPELPIEVQVESERRVLYRGRPRIGSYEVFVEHGFYPGTPGTSECVALSLVGSCPETAAVCSAQLLEYSDLFELVRW
jgi:hypothetical protein